MKRISLALVGLLAACGGNTPAPAVSTARPASAAVLSSPPSADASADFRTKVPTPGALKPPVFPSPMVRELPNGITLVAYEMHGVPVVRTTMVGFATKSAASTVRWQFAQRITAKHSVTALASAWQALGAEHGAIVGDDAGGLSAKVLAKDFGASVDLLAEEWLQPSKDAAELGRLKEELVDGVKNERADLKSVARNLVRIPLERYTRADSGAEKDIEAITIADVMKDARRLKLAYTAQPELPSVACPTVVFVVGDIAVAEAEKRIGAMVCPKLIGGVGGGYSGKGRQGVWRMNARKGATQVHLYLSTHGVPFGTSDERAAFWVASEILGGSFSSRINMNLREKNAFTYGAYARYRPFATNGLFSMGGPMKADKAGEALKEMNAELERIRTEPVTDDELRRAKDSWLRTLAARYETADDVVGAWLSDMITRDGSDEKNSFATEASRFTKAIEAVTKEDVLKVAKQLLDPKRLDLVTVGDPDVIKAELEPLKLGDPLMYDELGAPLNAK